MSYYSLQQGTNHMRGVSGMIFMLPWGWWPLGKDVTSPILVLWNCLKVWLAGVCLCAWWFLKGPDVLGVVPEISTQALSLYTINKWLLQNQFIKGTDWLIFKPLLWKFECIHSTNIYGTSLCVSHRAKWQGLSSHRNSGKCSERARRHIWTWPWLLHSPCWRDSAQSPRRKLGRHILPFAKPAPPMIVTLVGVRVDGVRCNPQTQTNSQGASQWDWCPPTLDPEEFFSTSPSCACSLGTKAHPLLPRGCTRVLELILPTTSARTPPSRQDQAPPQTLPPSCFSFHKIPFCPHGWG